MPPPPHTAPEFAGLIGVSREDITPPVGIYARNWGAASHEVAEGIHRPLTATALAFRTGAGDSPLVLIGLDLGWWRTIGDEWSLRGGLIQELSLNPARVMINLSHTHAAPAICREDSDRPGGHLIGPYLDRLNQAVVRCARNAIDSAVPAVLTWGWGRCGLATNRDLADPDQPRYVCGYNPMAHAEDSLMVARVSTSDQQVLATIVNYACHPTTLAWQNRLISPDYIGAMREVVESHTGGAPCLFLQGASGELAPQEQYTGDTAVADGHGRHLGFAALGALYGLPAPATRLEYGGVVESGAPLAVWKRTASHPSGRLGAVLVEVELPLKDLPSLQELDQQIALCEDRVLLERLRRKRRVRQGVGEGSVAKMGLWVWRLGDGAVVGQPNEAYSLLQTTLRNSFGHTPLMVMNCVNGHSGYLPPAALYDEDIYPVWQTPFARGSLERVIESSQNAVEQLFR